MLVYQRVMVVMENEYIKGQTTEKTTEKHFSIHK